MSEQKLLPDNIYIRIVRARTTGKPRLDIYRSLDDMHAPVQHIVKGGESFFLQDNDTYKKDNKEELHFSDCISKLVDKVLQSIN